MDIQGKLTILSDAAKYDVSCVSSGSSRKNTPGGIGSCATSRNGICHSWSDDGRCISLLKILLTNYCIYNCAYCVNRVTNDIPRTFFTPSEVADLTINFYRRNYIEGLFLSSAIYKSADYTMELLTETVRILRLQYRFNGYIHMKAIPGADAKLIEEAGRLVDRMSVNIELPSSEGLKLLAPQKKKEAIIKPMSFICSQISQNKEERRYLKNSPLFVPAGQSTQMIVGATPDRDLSILKLSENLYKHYRLRRVFYSAYVPVSNHPNLPAIAKPPLLREHRLYQADWLLRFYGFEANEILNDTHPDLDTAIDPKSDWAVRNLHLFPVEINRADYSMLLRVPGVGVQSAQRIVSSRRFSALNYEHLRKIGVVLKRARHFITCNGKYFGDLAFNESLIRQSLEEKTPVKADSGSQYEQLSIFSLTQSLIPVNNTISCITGEL